MTLRRKVSAVVRSVLTLGLAACPAYCPTQTSSEVTSVGVTATPGAVRLTAGTSATVSVRVDLERISGEASLGLSGPLPAGLKASWGRQSLPSGMSTELILTADTLASPGIVLIRVIASAVTGGGTGVARYDSTDIAITVQPPFDVVSPPATLMTVGTSRELPVGVSREPGFSGGVALSVEPGTVPAGTTVTFVPPVTTGNSAVLRLDVPDNAPTGRYLTRVVGRAGVNTSTRTFLLDVLAVQVPPDIGVVAAPVAASIAPGQQATFDLVLTRSVPGLGNILLTSSGAPTGATVTFTPQSVSGTSATMTVTTSASTPDGSYPIQVTATAGDLVRQTTVTLTVARPSDFTLQVVPSTLTVARLASGQAIVRLARTGPTTPVTLDVPAAPTGVSAVVSPSLVSGDSATVTVSVAATVEPGTYPLSVRGVAGSITRTAAFTLVVPAPPPSDLAITLLTPDVTVATGATALVPVRLARTGTAVGALVELRTMGVPPGGNAWIAPTFTRLDTATLQIIGGSAGTSSVVVRAMFGAFPPTAVATVTSVTSSTPDFSLTPLPTALTLPRGMFTPMSLEIRRTNGFTAAVALTAITDNPGNYLVEFDPPSTSNNNVLMRVYASPNITPGAHQLTIQGTAGGTVRTAVVTLIVQ